MIKKILNTNQNELVRFVTYHVFFTILHIWLFTKVLALAAQFVRVYATVYGQTISHLLIIIFAATFFALFRNFAKLAVLVNSKDSDISVFKQLGTVAVLILFSLTFLTLAPEYVLTVANALR